MSRLALNLMTAVTAEVDRLRQVIRDSSALMMAANLSEHLEMPATPTRRNRVDAINLVRDPVGQSGAWMTRWEAVNATMSQAQIGDLPRWVYAVRAVATGAGTGDVALRSRLLDGEIEAGLHYYYALVRSEHGDPANELRFVRDHDDTLLVTVEIADSLLGWTLVGGEVEIPVPTAVLDGQHVLPTTPIAVDSTADFQAPGELMIGNQKVAYTGKTATTFTGCTGGSGTMEDGTPVTRTHPGTMRMVFRVENPPIGTEAMMTGTTVVAGVDPGEAFIGDFAETEKHAYGWQGGRFTSPSWRHGPEIDLMSLREAEHEFSVAPRDMTLAQRQAYLIARQRAHRKPWGETFQGLIVQVIQSADPTFSASGVRIIEDYPDRSFRVEVAYSPTGVLADRVKRLIEEIKPFGLNLDVDADIVWGAFQADISKAGDVL